MTTLVGTSYTSHHHHHHHHHHPHHQTEQEPYSPPPPLGGAASENQFGFPIEGDDVLLSTLAKVGITDVKESDVQHPTQQVALKCFTAFLELLSYVNEEVIDNLRGGCLDRLEHKELYDDSLRTVLLFREIRALMIASCVPDFTLADIARPKPKRFKKQMFALINFLRFSEHHIQHFDQLKEDTDHVFKKRDETAARLSEVQGRIEEEESIRRSQENRASELREQNAKLSGKLRDLKEEQSDLLSDLEDAKQDKNTVHARLLRLIETCRLLHEETDKLTLRIENTPSELRAMIEKQKRQLKEKKASVSEEEAKAQSMHERQKVLDGLENQIHTCAALVKTCAEDQVKLLREKQEVESVVLEAQHLAKDRDNVVIRLEQLQEQVRWAVERLERMHRNTDAKREENKRKAEQDAGEWEAVQVEKGRRAENVERLTQQLAKLEAEFEIIANDFDTFYAELMTQKRKLEHQCHSYMKALGAEMDLQIDL